MTDDLNISHYKIFRKTETDSSGSRFRWCILDTRTKNEYPYDSLTDLLKSLREVLTWDAGLGDGKPEYIEAIDLALKAQEPF